jgi:hypothetical protein
MSRRPHALSLGLFTHLPQDTQKALEKVMCPVSVKGLRDGGIIQAAAKFTEFFKILFILFTFTISGTLIIT